MADGRAWPGFQLRCCPVCGVEVGTHRERVDDDRGEVVAYHDHQDTSGRRCVMALERAAIRAVAFPASDTGISARRTADDLLHRPAGTRAADDLLDRLIEQETNALRAK